MTERAVAPTRLRQWLVELKRRRVLQVLAAYLVGTWLALQVADVAVLPALGIAGVGMRYLVMAAAAGLAIAFILSWRYEFSSQGIRRHESATGTDAPSAPLRTADRWKISALVVSALLVTAATIVQLASLAGRVGTEIPSASAPSVAAPGSLAVLPFANLSDDPQLDYFGEGLAEELINRLSTVSSLRVTARTSAFSFKDEDATVQEIGRALGVAHVLEGSVRRSGDKLRVMVHLVDATSGDRIWSMQYDRQFADVFVVQDDIATNVLDSLRIVLTPQQKSAMSSHGTSDAEALDLYLRGKYIYQRMEVGGLDTAIAHLRAAIARDPSFAAAYVALADALMFHTQIRTDQKFNDAVSESSERRRLLDTAIELDPSNADAYAILGNDLGLSMDYEGAYQRLARAEELNPNGELVLRYMGQYYSAVGWPPEKAIGYMRRGVELDPYNPWALTNLAIAYFNADQFEQALRTLDRAHELDPSFWVAWWVRDLVLFELGRYEEAVKAARRALELSGDYVDVYSDLIVVLVAAGHQAEAEEIFRRMEAPKQRPRWRPSFRAFALAGLGRDAEALDAIEDAIRLRDGFMPEMLDHRVFLPLHDDPRFLRIVAEVGQERRVARLRQRLGAQ